MYKAAIRHNLYQLVSQVLTFTKIPNEKRKYQNNYLLEILKTQLLFAIPK